MENDEYKLVFYCIFLAYVWWQWAFATTRHRKYLCYPCVAMSFVAGHCWKSIGVGRQSFGPPIARTAKPRTVTANTGHGWCKRLSRLLNAVANIVQLWLILRVMLCIRFPKNIAALIPPKRVLYSRHPSLTLYLYCVFLSDYHYLLFVSLSNNHWLTTNYWEYTKHSLRLPLILTVEQNAQVILIHQNTHWAELLLYLSCTCFFP